MNAFLRTSLTLVTTALLASSLYAGEPLKAYALRDEAISIAKVLRCPVSPNLTLYDSESQIASELKGVIYEKLREVRLANRFLTSWSNVMANRFAMNPT